jgi:hypothetical protein
MGYGVVELIPKKAKMRLHLYFYRSIEYGVVEQIQTIAKQQLKCAAIFTFTVP